MPYKDPEKAREYKNRWRREQRRKRGLQKQGRKPHNTEEKEKAKENRRTWEKNWRKQYSENQPERRLLWAAKRRAKVNNLEFNLTLDDIIIPQHCPYLGIPIVHSRPLGDSRRDVASLDRIDNTKGYTKDNIEVISWLANTMKSDASPELLIAFAKEILKRYD